MKVADSLDGFQAQLADFAFATRRAAWEAACRFDDRGRAEELGNTCMYLYKHLIDWDSIPNEYFKDFRAHINNRENKEMIRGREELLGAYAIRFARVEQRLNGFNVIGSGSESVAHRLGRFVVKQNISSDRGALDSSIVAYLMSRNLPVVEALEAASYDDGLLVTNFMAGIDLGHVDDKKREKILRENYDALEKFSKEIDSAGVAGDVAMSELYCNNIIFNKGSFYLIDPKPNGISATVKL